MKKLTLLLATIIAFSSLSAQSTKTAYLDLYQRGGGQHLRTTLTFDNRPVYVGRKNLGEMLNQLSSLGWEVTEPLVPVNRFDLYLTRHKFHILLKKQYSEDEDPFEGLRETTTAVLYQRSTPVPPTKKQKAVPAKSGSMAMEKKAFYNDNNLKTIDIPDDIVSIGRAAFSGCQNLAHVKIGQNVTLIGDYAFWECVSLTSLTIPERVAEIGGSAFSGCKNLASVYCRPTTPPSIDYFTFYNVSSSFRIYVPTASVAAYKSAPGWKNFFGQIYGYDFD